MAVATVPTVPAVRRSAGQHLELHPSTSSPKPAAAHLVHEDIDGRVQRRAALGGHGEEAEAHADVEPFTDAGAMQGLGLILGFG